MTEYFILAGVTIIALIGHIWIYKWVKFKMDEGAILAFLKQEFDAENNNQAFYSSDHIANQTDISSARVTHICQRSASIKSHASDNDSWQQQ